MECPYCNAENRDGVHFCSNCGKRIDQSAASSAGSKSSPGGTSLSGLSSSLAPGSRLQGGRYQIKKILGQGGMGAALLATDLRLDSKPVVIKELISDNTDPSKLQEDVRNFKREVSTLAHIDHPLVPNVTDHFQEGSRYFMVQEYVDGENLEERMDRVNQPMKEREALGYASEILDVLDYLSQQTPPIVHRDIKPANIIIGAKDKRAHLVDFGIARADENRNAKRKQTSALGTPGYAPPEQYQGNADPRSDLYALAATLHHLLTNRDPRNHPPFTYPPARALNPQLSPETERILTKALTNDINQRYQSAAAMKRDVDETLMKRFGVSGNMSSYTLGTSSVIPAVAAASPHAAQTVAGPAPQQQRQVPPTPHVPPPYNPGAGRPGGGYAGAGKVQPRKSSHVVRNFFLLLLVLAVIACAFFTPTILKLRSGTGSQGATATTSPATPVATLPPFVNGIGVTKVGGETIGLSDGTAAFDTNRADGQLKLQAASALKNGDAGAAQSLLSQALALPDESNDAEALIYQENQNVVSSGNPYVTFVVATVLTGQSYGVGRDDLQGAYVAQKEFNDGFKLTHNVEVRLLIANDGSKSTNASEVAGQIVQAAQKDKTIVGVMGWPFSGDTLNALGVLARANIPVVSETASSDLLSGKADFFRVAPSNKTEAVIGAKYVESSLHGKNVALFVDPANAYSSSLATDFKNQFTADGNTVVVTENYTVNNQAEIVDRLQDALQHNPDVIYFAGYATDIGVLLTDMPTSGPPVMGGDALYELQGYPSSARPNFNKLNFTSFAHPDEWKVLNIPQQAFFTQYQQAFDPSLKHQGNPYGYTRTSSDVIMAYDAMQTMLYASRNIISATGQTSFTPADFRQALTKINGAQAVQGVSGQISFDANGEPVNKAVVVVHISPDNHLVAEAVLGCYTKGSC